MAAGAAWILISRVCYNERVDDRPPNRYDSLGTTYGRSRHEDPRLARQIHATLRGARSVVNVGAGTGSYEPADRRVVAVEPSSVMIAGRPEHAAPAVVATAEALPFADRSFDAGMALWTIHHWTDPRQGLRELRRVARRVVVIAPAPELNDLWLMSEYFPAITATSGRPEIQPEAIATTLGGATRISRLLIPRDCTDGFPEAFWARPEAFLDPAIRANMSPFRLLDAEYVETGLERLRHDLQTGTWDRRHGHLRRRPHFDAGLRIVVSDAAG